MCIHTFFHLTIRRKTFDLAFLDSVEIVRPSCAESVVGASMFSGDFSFSAAMASICPIFQARRKNMHSAAAIYINPV